MKILRDKDYSRSSVLFHKKDREILSILCSNVRVPLSKIAKMLRISRQSVEYRVKMMQENHLIAGSRTVVDIKKLGYESYHFFVSVESKDGKRLIERCKKSKHCNTLIEYSGRWNFEVSIMAKSSQLARDYFIDLVKGLGVRDYSPTILVKTVSAKVLPRYVKLYSGTPKHIRNDPSFSKEFLSKTENYGADEKDRKILYGLSQDAQIKLKSLGRKVGLSYDAVSERIKKMIRSGYIIQFRPAIDFSVVDLSLVSLLIKTKRNLATKKEKVGKFLDREESVLWASEILGAWEYLVYILVKDQDEVNEFVIKINEELGSDAELSEILIGKGEHKYAFMTEAMTED